MKKILAVVLMCLFVLTGQAMAADKGITLEVDGQTVVPDSAPFLHKDYTMVPLRFVSGPLNADLAWDNQTKTAVLKKDGLNIALTIGSDKALVNGEEKIMPITAMEKDGRTFIPLRFVSENMGAYVEWVGEANLVKIQFPGFKAFKVYGYYYDANSLTMLKDYVNTFDNVIHFGYSLGVDGTVNEKANFLKDKFQTEAYDLCMSNGKKPLMLLTSFDKATCNTFLSDAVAKTKAITNITQVIQTKGLSGVDLDFEAVPVERRDDFTAFVRDLKTAVGPDVTVSLSVVPRSNAKQTWLDGYDYAGLAAACDQMIVMFYNQHYSGGAPGPVAGADWMRTTMDYLLQYIPANKLIAGLGGYGYSWPVAGGNGASIHIARSYELAAKYQSEILRHEASGVPYFNYTDENGVARQLWFEDATSMAQKTAIAKEYGVAGIAIWRMGFIPNDVWDAMMKVVNGTN